MKKTILIACTLIVYFTAFAQKGELDKPKPKQTASEKIAVSSTPEVKVDTLKVIVKTYEETESGLKYVAWQEGYVLRTTTFTPKGIVTTDDERQHLVVASDGRIGANKVEEVAYTKAFKKVESKIESVSQSDWK